MLFSSPVLPSTSQIDFVEYGGAEDEFLRQDVQPASRWEERCLTVEQTPFIGAASEVPEFHDVQAAQNEEFHEPGTSTSLLISTPHTKTSRTWFAKQVSYYCYS
ncbi:hypothetical protein COOONC_18111 [Cooperia oncophora]